MFSFLNRNDSSFIKKEDIDKIVEKEEKIPEEKIPEEKCGFGETFIEILLDEANDSGKVEKISFLAEALIEENVSKDMTVFLLIKELKKEN